MPTPDRREVAGRTLLNRAAICQALQVGESTAERWYSQRADNGHPEPVLREGRRLYWDEDQLLAWARAAGLTSGTTEDVIVVDGQRLISRAALARRWQINEQSAADLYVLRAENGHPEPARRRRRRWYWDEHEMTEWDAQRKAAMRAALTALDRDGDPDELVGIDEAARVLGFRGRSTISSYRTRNPGYFPDPDVAGQWRRSTLWEFADGRTGRGRGGRAAPRART